jgi:hypothetical protein
VAGSFSYSPSSGTVLPPGTGQVLSVTFTPADLLAYSPVVSSVMIDVAEGGGYEAWMSFPPGTPAAETLPDADYDHDRLSNLVEYGLGLDATDGVNPDAPRFVVIEDGGVDYPGVEFSVRSDDPALVLALEISPDVDSWTPYPLTFTGGAWTLGAGGPVVHSSVDHTMGVWRLQVRGAAPLNAESRLFMRISVTR